MPEPLSFSTRRTEIAGVSVLSLAEQFGTPLYVYDAEKIRTRLRDLSIFPWFATRRRRARIWRSSV